MRSQGKALFPVIRIMLCGEGRVGKSSLLETLIGNMFKALDSTRCLELKTASCAVDSSGSWKELCDKEAVEHVQEILLHKQLSLADQAEPCQLSDGDHQRNDEPAVLPAGTVPATDTLETPNLPSHEERARFSLLSVDEAIEHVISTAMSPEVSADVLTRIRHGTFGIVRMWDLAGQDGYRSIQCMLLPLSRAIYVIVYDATRPIGDTAPEASMCISGKEESVSRAVSGQSSLDYVIDWLDVVCGRTNSASGTEPVVYIVGCKGDMRIAVDGEESGTIEQITSRLKEEESKDRDALLQRLRGTKYEEMVKPENVYIVSNKERSYHGNSIESLQRAIANHAVTQTEVPMCWVSFGLALAPLASSTGRPWISKAEATRLALKLGAIKSTTDIESLLEYQHQLGNLLYCPQCDDLKDVVVIDVPHVVRIIGSLIQPCLRATDFRHGAQPNREDLRLYKKGFVTRHLLKRLWGKGADKVFMEKAENEEFMLKLMESFNIATSITLSSSESHKQDGPILLMPSVVSTTEEITPLPSTQHPAMFLCCESPNHFPGLFLLQLVVKCLRRFVSNRDCRPVDLKCVELGKSAVRVPWNDDNGISLAMLYAKESIQLHIEAVADRSAEDMAPYAREAFAFVKKSLEEVQYIIQCSVEWFRGTICDCCDEESSDAATSTCFPSGHIVELELGSFPYCCKRDKPLRIRSKAVCKAAFLWFDWKVVRCSSMVLLVPF